MAEDMNQTNVEDEAKKDDTAKEQANEPEKKYSDADLNEIINQKFAKWQEKQDKAVADAKAEAEKLAKMNADQKAQYESEQKDKQIADMKSQLQQIAMGKVATEMLSEMNIDATQSLLDFAERCTIFVPSFNRN